MDRRRRRARRRSSAGRSSTSTLPAAIRRRPPGASQRFGGAAFPLSERHGAWRVGVDGARRRSTSRRFPAASRPTSPTSDFTFNADRRPGRRAAIRAIRSAGCATSRRGRAGSLRRDLRRRPAAAAARRAPRGRARLPHGRARRRRSLRRSARLVTRPAGRADPRRAPAAVAGRLPPARRASACSTRSAARSTIGSTRSTTQASGSSRCSAKRLARLPISRDLRRYARALLRATPARRSSPRGDPPLPARDASRGRSMRSRSSARAELAGAVEAARARRSGRAARARRRARAATRARDRAYPRAHRRGAGSRDDLDARGRACAGASSRGRGRRMTVELRLALQDSAPQTSPTESAGCSGRSPAPSAHSTPVAGPARSRSRSPQRRRGGRRGQREDYLEAARAVAPENVRFVEGDAMALPFEYGSFDIAGSIAPAPPRPPSGARGLGARPRDAPRRPDADRGSARLDRPAPQPRAGPLRAAPRPEPQRLLPDADIRGFLDANDLVLLASEVDARAHRSRAAPRARRVPEEERVRDPRASRPTRLRGRGRLVRRPQARARLAARRGARSSVPRAPRRAAGRAPARRRRGDTGTTAR